eukprot:8446189-Pyramimonas_sp.AAC.2
MSYVTALIINRPVYCRAIRLRRRGRASSSSGRARSGCQRCSFQAEAASFEREFSRGCEHLGIFHYSGR